MASSKSSVQRDRRKQLLTEIHQLAGQAIFGTLSQTYRTCGNAGCRCHRGGPKHGPHLNITYRREGKTTGFHVPLAAQERVRAGVDAWWRLQDCLRQLAELNKEALLQEARKKVEL
jgi:hypothetical protein